MKQRPKGILAMALRTMGERNPRVRGPLPPLPTWPRDPEQILHLCNGGRQVVEKVGRLAERYRTHNGHILKVCSLIREHMRSGGTYLSFAEVRTILLESYKTFGVEYHLRQNANKGAGTFPDIVTECAPRMWTPRPVPSAEQQAEWDEEHARLNQDTLGRRGYAVNRTVKTERHHEIHPTLKLIGEF